LELGFTWAYLYTNCLHTVCTNREAITLKIMVTYKILLDTRRAKSDGAYAVTIRITFDRKSTTFNTGVFIKDELWLDDKVTINPSHPNASLLNKKITEQ
jgi:hypothetical protein